MCEIVDKRYRMLREEILCELKLARALVSSLNNRISETLTKEDIEILIQAANNKANNKKK